MISSCIQPVWMRFNWNYLKPRFPVWHAVVYCSLCKVNHCIRGKYRLLFDTKMCHKVGEKVLKIEPGSSRGIWEPHKIFFYKYDDITYPCISIDSIHMTFCKWSSMPKGGTLHFYMTVLSLKVLVLIHSLIPPNSFKDFCTKSWVIFRRFYVRNAQSWCSLGEISEKSSWKLPKCGFHHLQNNK